MTAARGKLQLSVYDMDIIHLIWTKDMRPESQMLREDWTTRCAAVYTDGGVLYSRTSPAGSFAWIAVDEDGAELFREWGVLVANDAMPGVTNNMTEFFAMLRALEAMPSGWVGRACTDSMNTVGRFGMGWKLRGIPNWWVMRLATLKKRLGKTVTYVPHKGHPSATEVKNGEGYGSGQQLFPVSKHQVECDRLCGGALRTWIAQMEALAR